jgi:hypothetical protein
MRMPLISRLLFTLSAIGLTVGAHVADLSPSHLFNDRWTPHAKFTQAKRFQWRCCSRC